MKARQHLAIGLTLFVCLAALLGCSHRESEADGSPAPSPRIEGDKIVFSARAPQLGYLTVETAQQGKPAATALNGRLAWDDDITARVFPAVSGRIVEIIARPSQRVASGEALAKIKSPDFGQAQAEASKAAADQELAERALRRTRELFEHGAAAKKDLESAEADSARALSERDRANATLSLYGGNGNSINGVFSMKAPISGVVVDKSVTHGQEVRSDQVGDKPLFVISDPARLWLYLDVSETDVVSLKPNQEVIVRSRALPDKIFHARIEVIGEGLDPATRTAKVRCVVDNSEKLLRAEMYVSAEVAASAASDVDVTTKAVFLKDNQHYIFIETAPGQFERRAVKLGPENNGRSAILAGLSPNERVVTDGCLLLEAILEGENS